MEKPAVAPDGYMCYSHTNASDIKQELDAPTRIQTHQASHAKLGFTDITPLEHGANHPLSDLEEPPIESDDDVPYFSDIEAMILDMDLDPEDRIYIPARKSAVSRYQHEDMKRVIMRLEQGAQSCMQRAIASQGAFAVLYGRHSKHYIKKPEVLLGRATEDVIVDIELGREGGANKISRRQATITLDKGGSFHLKNLGKCSISVNDKEIAPGQSLNLASSCLIEEKRAFLFCQQDRATLCRDCDVPIHEANEHTQKHNRFLLTGVKLSATSAFYVPSSSVTNGGDLVFDSKSQQQSSTKKPVSFSLPSSNPPSLAKTSSPNSTVNKALSETRRW
ncbi:hypothetical protein GH714_006322 [Hevea brasiliensis]|uniref:FHA domain-containing protein n=1 Tax=Hevea brasiliensis TaxID=3981 RepID=A0A6A6MC22_HEVBR|nr:hypothetical protein GH714_006322 [Hevea brasiliensis]